MVFSIMTVSCRFGLSGNMGYSRVDCRAGVFALLALFLVPTLWGTLPCPYPVGDSALSPTLLWTDNLRHENHLNVDCPGVGQVASVRGLPGSRAGCTGLTNGTYSGGQDLQ